MEAWLVAGVSLDEAPAVGAFVGIGELRAFRDALGTVVGVALARVELRGGAPCAEAFSVEDAAAALATTRETLRRAGLQAEPRLQLMLVDADARSFRAP